MFRLQIRQSYLKEHIFYGEPFENLHQAYDILSKLEEEWTRWMMKGHPKLSPDNPIQFLEGGETFVVSDSGLVYTQEDDCQFHVMN